MTGDIRARYEAAQQLWNTAWPNSVPNAAVFSRWIKGRPCFWYVRRAKAGKEFRLVDAKAASNVPAFDHVVLAAALGKAAGEAVDPEYLPLTDLDFSSSAPQIRFQSFGKHWLYDPGAELCQEDRGVQTVGGEESKAGATEFWPTMRTRVAHSPDGKHAALLRDNNIWIRDLTTGKERALTKDGVDTFRYARDGDFDYLQAQWSSDSTQLFTFRFDVREVPTKSMIAYVPPDGLHPQLRQPRRAYSGEANVDSIQYLAIEVATGKMQLADYRPVPALVFGAYPEQRYLGHHPMGWWSKDNRLAFFIDLARGAKSVRVVEFDTQTGSTRVVFEETSDTFISLRPQSFEGPLLFQPLPETNELIWYSERSGWGHLYLYDLKTGQLKSTITQGEFLLRDILHFDPTRRELLVHTAGRDPDISPYYRDICRVNVDSGRLTPILTGNHEHIVYQPLSFLSMHSWIYVVPDLFESGEPVSGVSPCGEYLVATRSRVDTVPVSVLIDRDGREILALETADVSDLPENWVWPEPVKLKGADGETDIYGVVYRPPGFSPEEKYAVVNYSDSMRSLSTLPQGSFVNGAFCGYEYMVASAFAALGFVVVAIEGRGLPLRNRAFRDHHFGDHYFTNDFDDRIAGMRQLAEQYPYMDLERVGITGEETVNNNIYAMLKHSDFFKVGVMNCISDQRFASASETEVYGASPDPKIIAGARYAEDDVESFKGKMLLIQGMLSGYTAASTFRLVEALQKANKDFEMLCMPNMIHGISSYTLRRNWDYLVRHLQGIEPPHEFRLRSKCFGEG